MKRKNILPVICMLIILSFTACNKFDNYLDKAESGGMSEEEVFGNFRQTKAYLANIYGTGLYIDWYGGAMWGFSFDGATDDGYGAYKYWPCPKFFYDGSLSPNNNPMDKWADLYFSIRKTNIFLQKIDALPIQSNNAEQAQEKPWMKGEAFFLRAWFYAEMYKRYGAVPIVDRPLLITDNLNLRRNSADSVMQFITANCDSAIALLPPKYSLKDLGRPTKGAAQLLKARTLLYAASPWQNKANDKTRWQKAADAAKVLIDEKMYDLDASYKGLFHTRSSPEVIFQSNVNDQNHLHDYLMPSQAGFSILQPLQGIVDAYEMKNGMSINTPGSGYDANDPYKDRDPRLAMSILYNGQKWRGFPIETFVGGLDGLNKNGGGGEYTHTGYYIAKTLDETGSLTPEWRPGSHYYVYMRFAEALLIYAEAQNEAADLPDQTIYDAINRIRDRQGVKMPHIPQGLSKDEMRIKIRHERRIELAFENQRFWDIRRWQITTEVLREAWGMRITKDAGGNFTYNKFLIESRTGLKPAFNLYPIPQSEMNRNNALIQNPGY
jgi:hypothetical protein